MKKAWISLCILCITFISCYDPWNNPKLVTRITNNSDKDVCFVFCIDIRNGNLYPTTEWPEERPESSDFRVVKPNEKSKISYTILDTKVNPDDVFAVFALDPDTLAKYSWEQLGVDQNYLKKYECKVSELNNIVYL